MAWCRALPTLPMQTHSRRRNAAAREAAPRVPAVAMAAVRTARECVANVLAGIVLVLATAQAVEHPLRVERCRRPPLSWASVLLQRLVLRPGLVQALGQDPVTLWVREQGPVMLWVREALRKVVTVMTRVLCPRLTSF